MAAAPAARLEETLTDCGERDTRALPVLVSKAPRFDVAPTVTAVTTVLIALASSPSQLTSPSAGPLVLPGRASFETPR
ncbi:hypothetical protein [Streptomyces sp. 3214.6]|uniref:hypothetical protein n=1 Tax=Streptomyces sp. 3214.6 TaxID=1882757 RepID=UPI00090CAF8E|nr:hypothetical protein [Streptomyces sp. 3214.6]SHH86104.1 hypothetical protein SAMN05444521_2279 [Streptomyces sp. 3214.6]